MLHFLTIYITKVSTRLYYGQWYKHRRPRVIHEYTILDDIIWHYSHCIYHIHHTISFSLVIGDILLIIRRGIIKYWMTSYDNVYILKDSGYAKPFLVARNNTRWANRSARYLYNFGWYNMNKVFLNLFLCTSIKYTEFGFSSIVIQNGYVKRLMDNPKLYTSLHDVAFALDDIIW